jgi:transposase InsO family protein
MEGRALGQVLHGCATTTTAIRRAIQHSQASLRALAKRCGINPKTVAKWRQRSSVADRPTGPKAAKSTVLSIEEEAIVVAFRRHTLLPLDDCLYALQATIPHLTRSSLHRCLQRHGISRLPDVEGNPPSKQKFKRYPIGYFHIDIAEVQTAEGRLYLFVAIDRTSKFAFTELHAKATTRIAADFLNALIKAVPYKVHTVLTDNGTHFTNPRGETWSPAEIRQMIECKQPFRAHAFEYACALANIDHRLTKPKHPWTNGQVERMNRTIKEATVRRFHYDTHDPAPRPPGRFRRRLQLRPAAQDPQGPHPLRVHLQSLDNRAEPLHPQPTPANPGTKQLSATTGLDFPLPVRSLVPAVHAPENVERDGLRGITLPRLVSA